MQFSPDLSDTRLTVDRLIRKKTSSSALKLPEISDILSVIKFDRNDNIGIWKYSGNETKSTEM